MNIGHTLRPGNSLQPLADMIDTHVMNDGGPADPMPRDVQHSPFVARNNLQTAKFALDHIRPEAMAEFLADYLAIRLGRVKASFIGRDIARISETGK